VRYISLRFIVLSVLIVAGINSYCQISTTEEQRISDLLAKLEAEDRTVEELISEDLTHLPVGIKRTVGNTTIIIAVDSALITPQGMFINAYTQIVLPGTTEKISLAARNILITPSGIDQSAPGRLVMISECHIKLNDQLTLSLPANGQNYIDWDCYGFRSVNLNGVFEFSDQFFTPDPEMAENQDKVTAPFEVNISDLNSILVSTSITPFRLKSAGEITFVVSNASADMSDYSNCEGFAWPVGYQNILPDAPQLWRGFFMKDMIVYLPGELGSSTDRSSVSAHNLLIDENGITGIFSASNVLPLNRGSASGWPFSINRISISLTENRLSAGDLEGLLGVPFLNDDTLGYKAQIESTQYGLQYFFAVAFNDTRQFSMPFGGTLKLDRGSEFMMEIRDRKFIPSAILNGSISIDTGKINAEELRFERLHLTSENPYILGGTFASSGDIGYKIAGFGFSIDNILLNVQQGRALLEFNVGVALMNSNDMGVGADTKFILTASVVDNLNAQNEFHSEQEWQYAGIQIEDVKVFGEISIFKFEGSVAVFTNHPVYGDGFHGNIGLEIKKILDEPAEVEIYFGTKDNFRYWFTKIDIPLNIPIGSSPIILKKLGGGAYNKMIRHIINNGDPIYTPDAGAGLGFIAQTGLCVKDEGIFYADATFEIAFRSNGGVRYIRFSGEGEFFSDSEPNGPAPLRAGIIMVFDNQNDVFHANLQVKMNLANVIKGTGPDGLLGEAVIHCDPNDWYIYIGRPSFPLGVSVLGLSTVQTYFMAGTLIEDMPLPPSEVGSIIGNIDMDFMRNENLLSTGNGVAFGMQFKTNFGFGQSSGFVYAYLNAGAGADIMLRNFGSIQCEGRSGPIGINGWYASGQGYAYLQGKIGIRARRIEFDIMNVAAALLLQAKMPNPSWFRGNIAARYNILGGLIKGKVNLAVTLGEECVIVANGNELGELELIGDISPANGENEVDVFASPQVAFNTNIDKEFGMLNVLDQYDVYRVRLDEYKLMTSDNQSISGTVQWNSEKDLAVFEIQNILPGNQQISTSAKVHIEKKSNGYWIPVEVNGATNYEVKMASFTTGDEPKSIPANNVKFSYPLINQYNFYKNEYTRGYIKLKTGQENLFRPETSGTKWDYQVRFTTGTSSVETPATYNEAEAMVNFIIPTSLNNLNIYEMVIIKKPAYAGTIDRNLQRGSNYLSVANAEDSLSVVHNQLTGSITTETESELYRSTFRTSKYPTFLEKLNSISKVRVNSADDETHFSLPILNSDMDETFDKYELKGSGNNFEPLITAEALPGTAWIDNHIYPMVYELYGTIPDIYLSRNTDILGLVPLKGMSVVNRNMADYLLTSEQSAAKSGEISFWYMVPHFVYLDFYELRNKAASLYLNKPTIPLQAFRLLSGVIQNTSYGNYPFKVSYRLPGLNLITSSKELIIKYGAD
jgi:hypothetical protein